MPTLPETFDAILLGAGQTNNPLGRTLARGGWKVALIEKGDVGGTCANVGCTPTKAMIGCARVAHQARRGAEFGIHVGDVVVRLDEVRERTQGIVKDFRTGSERELAATNGLELIRGEGSFTGPRAVLVKLNDGGERRLAARVVVIDTGGLPARPDIPGLDSVPWLDSTGMLDLVEVPERLTVLGGGYIGLEYAQMFQRFGGRVTVLQKDDQLMSSEDPDMAAALAEILRGEGIEIHLNAEATRVSGSAGDVRVTYQTEGREREAAGTHLLVAVGRSPNTEALNLAAAGVETDDRGYIKVDEKLETNVPGVYAPGDVNGGPAFTQVAHNDNRILRDNLLRDAGRVTTGRLIPMVTFTDPQYGRVGLTEKQARQEGRRIRIARMPMNQVSRAIEIGEDRGLIKAVVDAETDQILGCAALAFEGGEIMSMVQVAMMGDLPYQRLRDDMFAHPTLARGLNGLFASFVE